MEKLQNPSHAGASPLLQPMPGALLQLQQFSEKPGRAQLPSTGEAGFEDRELSRVTVGWDTARQQCSFYIHRLAEVVQIKLLFWMSPALLP